jgi:hypothetical protein
VVIAGHNKLYKPNLVVGHQAGVMHCAGHAHGFGLQGSAVGRVQALRVSVQPRVVATQMRRAEKGADQAIGAYRAGVAYAVLVGVHGHGNLHDHGLYRPNLQRPLSEDAPNLIDQTTQDAFRTNLFQDVFEQLVNRRA